MGLGVGLLDVLTGSPGGFCSPPLKCVLPIPACVLHALSGAWHTGGTGQSRFH